MAYSIDYATGDLVIQGFDQGIGSSPYTGLTDMKSINPASILGEAPVNFSTQSVTNAPSVGTASNPVSATVTASPSYIYIPATQLVETQQWIFIVSAGSSGLSTTTPYLLTYIGNGGGNNEYTLRTAIGGSTVTIGGNSTVTFYTIIPSMPKFFSEASVANFMIDLSGRVWSNFLPSGSGGGPSTSSWTWTGNTVLVNAFGNGMTYWRSSNATAIGDWDGWLFILRDGFIDLSNVDGVNNGVAYNNVGTWVYGWNPLNATTGNTSAYLTGSNLTNCPHNAIVGPDGNVYFCDYYTMRKIEQTNIVTPITFSPTSSATYIYSVGHILPINEIATCIAPLGVNFIIGGAGNQAYIWDGVNQLTITNPILLAESYVQNIVTVNVNAYIFCGNRGNIYVTNGSQASPFAKIPDHISQVIEPNFFWGGATYQKNRLYFSAYVTNNSETIDPVGYGGVWAIDLSTNALWLANQLSYGTYTGFASALAAVPIKFNGPAMVIDPIGSGLLIGWVNGANNGVDVTISTPYLNGASWVVSDLIAVGTALKPMTGYQVEYKLSTPLKTGESVQLLMGSSLNDLYGTGSMTTLGTTTGTGVEISDNFPIVVQEQQWILIQAILISISSGGSYCRLVQLRVIGDTVKTQTQTQPFATQ